MPDPFDASAPLADRARAYLHTNCAQCHRAGGPTPSSMDLRYSTLLSSTNACGAPPQAGDLGFGAGARLIAPGDAAHSVLVARMARRDANGMPPLASHIVDTEGVALLEQWIAGLTTCQ
jgi:mono/diheme cytochrome c family protein